MPKKKTTRKASTPIKSVLASNIRDYRERHGLSQEKFADLCNLHRTYVGSVERCERNATLSTLEVFAEVIGVSVPVLLTEKAPRK